MADHYSQASADNIRYDPLPNTQDAERLHAAGPPSPNASTPAFHTPAMETSELPGDAGLPTGAGQPRFLGRALYDEGNPSIRNSYAASLGQESLTSDHNSSVYALNPTGAAGASPYSYDGYRDDPRDSYYAGSRSDLPLSPVGAGRYMEEKRGAYASPAKSKRKIIIFSVIGALIVIIAAVAIPLYFAVFKKKGDGATGGGSSTGTAKPTSTSAASAITGGDGTQVTFEDGTKVTYKNAWGGQWYYDEKDPFNNGAKANSWTPGLNETFNYGIDKINGVNIGGWLTTEPFISPALFEKYLNQPNPPTDEWTLSLAMAADTAGGGLTQLETHYKTFITEQDFMDIAGAGLNYVRIPIPFWAIETRDGEPFLAKTAWTYFLKAIKWARKYGIRINLDFHALPGSQNGWNHSGRLGTINMLNGPMGYANAQRSLDYIRILAEFISQPQYRDVVTMFGITNEPLGPTIGQDTLSSFYAQAYQIVRTASGTGAGNGPIISLHEGFMGLGKWAGFLQNADRVALDLHPYLCFGQQSDASLDTLHNIPCGNWGPQLNTSMGAFGLTGAGEWSNANTDCGLWVNGVNLGQRYDGTFVSQQTTAVGSCDAWTKWENYTPQLKTQIKNFAMATMDGLGNWFFWTWKIGNSTVLGTVGSPAWSYKLGLDNGWMPASPREAIGACGTPAQPWTPPLKPNNLGAANAPVIDAAGLAQYPWPPVAISNGGAPTALPAYTPTGAVPTLPPPTLTATQAGATVTANPGNGWQNPADTAGLMVAMASCSYLDPWVGPNAAPPAPLCTGT